METDTFGMVGFNDWRNSGRSIKSHEISKIHTDSYLAYRRRAKELTSIESSFMNAEETEMNYWRKVLKRIVSVVKFLGARGLAFRGKNQTIGSNQNGNFIGTLELLSEYDSFLSAHLSRYGNEGKGRASNLSANICHEFILLIAEAVENYILAGVRAAKYYSISMDSTPDVSHTDQLVFCIRYTKDSKPVERFLRFIPIEQHTAEYLKDIVIDYLREKGIDIMDCRGQSYDNASNMSGCYSGLQTRITEINPKAIFVPCGSHSLNLVGKNAVDDNPNATAFFHLIESLYHFFVYSTYRWEKLKNALSDQKEFLLKRATGTRWSSKNDAVAGINASYEKIIVVLKSLLEGDQLQTEDNKATAKGLILKFCKFDTILMLKIWRTILSHFQRVNVFLQKSDMNLSVAAKSYNSLISLMEKIGDQYDSIFEDASSVYEKVQVHTDDISHVTTRSMSTSSRNTPEEDKENFKTRLFTPIVQSLLTNLKARGAIYSELNEKFSFLTNLNKLSLDEITKSCENICSFYPEDLDKDELIGECQFAAEHFSFDRATHASIYESIIDDGLQGTLPNIGIILQMYVRPKCLRRKIIFEAKIHQK